MGKSKDLAELAGVTSRLDTVGASSGALSNRNIIINGAMDVAQRGTSFTNPSVSAYTLDRWSTVYSHDGAVDVSQSTTTPAGFKNSLKIDVTTADSSLSSSQYYILQQIIEGQNLSHLNYGSSDAKEVTVSFWVRSNKTGTYYVEIQTSGSQELARPYTINTANTWEHKTLTWIANTDFTITETNAAGVILYWWLAGGSAYTGSPLATTWANNTNRVTGQTNFLDSTSNEFYITGVQLEVGDTATDFEHRSFADELQRCQRYYYIMDSSTSNGSYLRYCNAFYKSATAAEGVIHLPVEMRATPTLTASGTIAMYDGANLLTISTFVLGNDGSSNRIVVFDANNIASGGVQHRPGVFLSNANTTSKVELSSEL